MRRIRTTTLLIGMLAAAPALAIEPKVGTTPGKRATEIATALGANSRRMTQYERERRRIEVSGDCNGRRLGATVDPRKSAIPEIEEQS